jgi:rhomboid family GlyGly-CTERM serine protease
LAERGLASRPFAWPALAVLLACGALLAGSAEWARVVDPASIDWQPALALQQPWRTLSAAFVHYSGLHLAANLAGTVLVGALGHVARLPLRSAAAWLAAWPLTQLALLLQPSLLHYGGLSGVLHAGVAVAGVQLLAAGTPMQRRIAAAICAGLVVKLLSEAPWQGALRRPVGWDIAVAPFAHVTGVVTGTLASAVAEAWHRVACTKP